LAVVGAVVVTLSTTVVCAVLFGVNAQLESEGNPTQLYVSAWLKPFVGVTVMLADPLCPGVTVMEGTLGASEKPGTPVTVSVI
jgi:hypothetical protein